MTHAGVDGHAGVSVTADDAVCAHLDVAEIDVRCTGWDGQPPTDRPTQALVGRSESFPAAGVIAWCPSVSPAAVYDRGLDPIGPDAPPSMALTLAGLITQLLAADGTPTDHLLVINADGHTDRIPVYPPPLPRDAPVTAGVVGDDLGAAIDAAETAVDPHVGLIAAVSEEASSPLPYYLAQLAAHPAAHADQQGRLAAGVGLEWDRAYMRALGEALERYAASIYDPHALEQAPPGAIEPAVSLSQVVRPSSAIPPSLPWVSGLDLLTRAAIAVPAGLVYHPPPGPTVRPPITTGLALARSRPSAIYKGLLEVLERDALMRMWYGDAPAHRVTLATDQIDAVRARLRAVELTVACWALPTDLGVPVCVAAVHRSSGYPHCAFGSAAAATPTAAAEHAVIEATQNWMELDAMGPEKTAATYDGVAQYAAAPEAAFDALPGPDEAVGLESIIAPGPADLESLIEQIAAHELDAVAVSVTTADLRVLGFEVVRAIIPTAQPLFLGEPYFGDRVSADASAIHTRRPHPFP
jgi:Uncharacterized conserved protein